MAVYHQMGHATVNLIPEVMGYRGAILSPVNCTEALALSWAEEHQSKDFEFVFDPQLYFPRSDRGQLADWPYFPKELDTADLSSAAWWEGVNKKLLACAVAAGLRRVCSPTMVPRGGYSDEYFTFFRDVASRLAVLAQKKKIEVLQTVLWPLDEITSLDRVMQCASIFTGGDARAVYLVLVSDLKPRKEYGDADQLRAVLRFISALREAEVSTTVGFCNAESILFTEAGAAACATGKFFNLRRFTKSRFEEPQDGGGQLPYWFEESLLATIRESDLTRLRDMGMLSAASHANPFGKQILEMLAKPAKERTAWVALGWRQYMHWFADVDRRLRKGEAKATELLRTADANWERLEEEGFFMAERGNDGGWIRSWLRALNEYAKEW